jgi:MFS family permease
VKFITTWAKSPLFLIFVRIPTLRKRLRGLILEFPDGAPGPEEPAAPAHTPDNPYGVPKVAQVLASIVFLLFGYAAVIGGTSLLGITVPLELRADGTSTEVIGLVGTAFFAGFLLGARYSRIAIMQVGHVRVFAGLAALSAASALMFPFLPFPAGWMVLRFINGFCLVGIGAVTESWLNERCTNGNRGGVMGIYMVVNYFAVACGQLLVNVTDLGGSEAFMLVAFLFSLSLVPMVLSRTPSPDMGHVETLSFRQLYALTPLAVVGSGVAGVLTGTFYGMGALFARSIGLSVLEVSVFTATVIGGGLLFQFPVGWLSDRFDRRGVLAAVLFSVVLVSLALMAAGALGEHFWALLVLGALLGASMTVVYPISIAHAFDHVARERFVAASSGLLLAFGVGATAGPLLASIAMGQVGPYGFFVFFATVAAIFAGFVVYRWQRRERVEGVSLVVKV